MRPEWAIDDLRSLTGMLKAHPDHVGFFKIYGKKVKLLIYQDGILDLMQGSRPKNSDDWRIDTLVAGEFPWEGDTFQEIINFFECPLRDVPLHLHDWPDLAKWRLQVGK
jgi:hypothetical protein